MRTFLNGAKVAIVGAVMLTPFILHAATPRTFKEIIDRIVDLLLRLIPILIGIALLVFFWGLTKFMYGGADSPEKRSEGRMIMIWGVIALAVMVSIGGILAMLGQSFSIPL
jgi:purine-cytosine permease-like protein